MSITADHPYVQAALTPEAVPAQLMLLRLNVFEPFGFREAVIPVRKATDPIRVTAHAANMFFTGAADCLNSVVQSVLDCRFPCHQLLLVVVRALRRSRRGRKPCSPGPMP